MREILFRGKRIDNGEWVYGAFCPKDSDMPFSPMVDKPSIIKLDAPLDGFWFEVDPATVGQYTGLKDKNGKRIFEGDIINGYTLTGVNDRRGVVVAWNELFSVWYAGENKSLFGGLGETYEIIGNIHDNPELLKGGEGDC